MEKGECDKELVQKYRVDYTKLFLDGNSVFFELVKNGYYCTDGRVQNFCLSSENKLCMIDLDEVKRIPEEYSKFSEYYIQFMMLIFYMSFVMRYNIFMDFIFDEQTTHYLFLDGIKKIPGAVKAINNVSFNLNQPWTNNTFETYTIFKDTILKRIIQKLNKNSNSNSISEDNLYDEPIFCAPGIREKVSNALHSVWSFCSMLLVPRASASSENSSSASSSSAAVASAELASSSILGKRKLGGRRKTIRRKLKSRKVRRNRSKNRK